MFNKFLEKANKKHNSKFSYKDFLYVSAKVKGTIHCPIHGSFEQTPDKHLQSKHGCYECSVNARKGIRRTAPNKGQFKYTWEQQQNRLSEKFPHFTFHCISFVGVYSKVELTCPTHGVHTSNIHSLLHPNTSFGCVKCGRENTKRILTLTFKDFVKKANILYNNAYTYTADNYTNTRSKVMCNCEIHGDFEKSADKHLAGQGCPKCNIERLIFEGRLPGGYCETIFNRSDELKHSVGCIYYLKIGDVYKVGITTNLQRRIIGLKSKFKEDVTLIDKHESTLYEAYILEQELLELHKEHRVRNEHSTELFCSNVLRGKILK